MEKNTFLLISDDEYFAAEGLNYSTIKNFAISPKHYKYFLDNPQPATQAQDFGSACHCAVLRPEIYDSNYFECDEKIDRRTKEGKAIVEEAGERQIVPSIIRSQIAPEVAKIVDFSKTINEASIFWTDCKAKIDAYDPEEQIIYDVKATSESTPDGFAKSFLKYKYYLQAAHYVNAVQATGAKVKAYKILTIENKAPYDVALYNVDPLYIEYGQNELVELLKGIRECEFNDEWAGINRPELTIALPNFLTLSQKGE